MSCLCFSFINLVDTESLPELIHLLLRQWPPVAASGLVSVHLPHPTWEQNPLSIEG